MTLPMQDLTVRAKAIGVSFGISSNGNHQIAIQCEVVDDEQHSGESIAWIGHFTEKTQARTLESIQHFGFAGDDLATLENAGAAQCEELLPNVVELVCSPEEYNGNWTLKVKWVNKPGAGRFAFQKPLSGNDLKSFAAQMKGALRNARGGSRPAGGNARPSKPQPSHPNAPANHSGSFGNDDDVPF